jgi:hypothetical protein
MACQRTPLQFLMPDLQFESERDYFPSLDCMIVEVWDEKNEKALRRLKQLNALINRRSPKSVQDRADQAKFQLLLLKKEKIVAQKWYANAKLIDVVSAHVLSDKVTHLLPVTILLRPEQSCSPYDPSCEPLSHFEQQRLQEAWRLYEAKIDTQVGIQLLSEEMVAVTGPTT